jgi:hypothetical protein
LFVEKRTASISIPSIIIVSVFFSCSRRENMGVLCLFVQEQRSKINLFLHSNDELSPYQTLLISKHFSKYIQKITDARGDVVLLNRFRAMFLLLNEVYVVAVCYSSDYPFDALRCISHAKKLLFETCKSVEVTASTVFRKYGQVMLAFEELLHENNTFKDPSKAMEIVSKNKLSDTVVPTNSLMNTIMTNPRLRRGTIRKIETDIEQNVNLNWIETRKRTEVHKKRFDNLEKFSFETCADEAAKEAELLLSYFDDGFSAPTEEPLPNFNNRTRNQSTLDSRDNGISSTRLKQLSTLTKSNLEMLDDTFGTLVTPTFNSSFIVKHHQKSMEMDVNGTNGVLPFTTNGNMEEPKKKLENFNLLRPETESPDNSESSSDTFTVSSTSCSVAQNNRNSLSSISSIFVDSPPNYSKPAMSTNNMSNANILDDFFSSSNNNAPATALKPGNVAPVKSNTQEKISSISVDLDELFSGLPSSTTESTNIPPSSNLSSSSSKVIPPPPPSQDFSTTSQSKRSTYENNNKQQEQKKVIPPPHINKPVQAPAFDPSQILKKFEERAQVIYLTAVVQEKIEVVYMGANRTKYQLIGEILVKPFTSDQSHGLTQHDFVLSLSKTDKICTIRCNTKYCQQIKQNEYNFKCQVPSADIAKNPVTLLKYKLQENIQPMPIMVQPRYKVQNDVMSIIVKYKVNPETPLKDISLLIQPIMKEHLDGGLSVVAAKSKPEGRWAQQHQKLLWRLQDISFNPEQKQGEMLVAKFKMNKNPLTGFDPKYAPGPILIKLHSHGRVFGGVYVEGGDSKRNAVTNQVFVGGCEYSIDCPDFQIVMTPDQLITS